MRRYEFDATMDLLDIMRDWKGTDAYGIVESFIAWNENVNEPHFLNQVYNYDLMYELQDWFVDNGGDLDAYNTKYGTYH